MSSYVYLTSDQGDGTDLYVVGFYGPDNKWQPESDHETLESAEDRINFLHGGASVGLQAACQKLSQRNQELGYQIERLKRDYVSKETAQGFIEQRDRYADMLVELKNYITKGTPYPAKTIEAIELARGIGGFQQHGPVQE